MTNELIKTDVHLAWMYGDTEGLLRRFRDRCKINCYI